MSNEQASTLEAEFYKAIKFLSKRQQGYVMGAFREVLSASASGASVSLDVEAIRLIAVELEQDAANYTGDFADTVQGCAASLHRLIDAASVGAQVAPSDDTVVAKLPDIHAKLREAYVAGAKYRGGSGIDAHAYITAEQIMRAWDLPDAAPSEPVEGETRYCQVCERPQIGEYNDNHDRGCPNDTPSEEFEAKPITDAEIADIAAANRDICTPSEQAFQDAITHGISITRIAPADFLAAPVPAPATVLTRAQREVRKQQVDPKLSTTGATAYERFLHAELTRLQAAVIADAPVPAPEPSYWMSIQHGEFKVSYTDDSDPVYEWFPVWTKPVPAPATVDSASPATPVADRDAVLEEAARICDSGNVYDNPMTGRDFAAKIRALKGKAAPAAQAVEPPQVIIMGGTMELCQRDKDGLFKAVKGTGPVQTPSGWQVALTTPAAVPQDTQQEKP